MARQRYPLLARGSRVVGNELAPGAAPLPFAYGDPTDGSQILEIYLGDDYREAYQAGLITGAEVTFEISGPGEVFFAMYWDDVPDRVSPYPEPGFPVNAWPREDWDQLAYFTALTSPTTTGTTTSQVPAGSYTFDLWAGNAPIYDNFHSYAARPGEALLISAAFAEIPGEGSTPGAPGVYAIMHGFQAPSGGWPTLERFEVAFLGPRDTNIVVPSLGTWTLSGRAGDTELAWF